MTTVETRRQILFNRRESGVAMILLDGTGKLNYLGSSVMRELQEVLRVAIDDASIRAIVMMSAKVDNFVIGADLFEIRKASGRDEIFKLCTEGHAALDMVANCPKPVVMAINGPCLGGGLELALAGHWRMATDDARTQFAFPETRLGLIPGLGGTQRCPRLIGLKAAIGMILSAEAIHAAEAQSMGLVDEVVAAAVLMEAAEKRALELANDRSPLAARDAKIPELDDGKAGKLFAMTERSVRIKTRGHYPAQTKAIEVVRTGMEKGFEEGRRAEIEAFADLATGDVAANLIALFFATDFARQSAASLAAKFDEAGTSRIGIVGGGMMGTTIASLASQRELSVKLLVNAGREEDTLERVVSRDRVECTSDWSQLADAQFVLEAVAEEVEAKQQVMRQVEAVVSPDCTIASNTSSLPLDEIGSVLKKSDRFVGVHFFHPVDRMPLVEVIALKTTARKSLARAADFVSKLDKIPAMVKNGPGFLINRLLTRYIMEASRAAGEGVPIPWLEESAIHFGMPIGPFEVLDEVGEDVAFSVVDSLEKALGERFAPAQIFHDFRDLGAKGKRYGEGVYLWDETGKRREINPAIESIPYLRVSAEKCPEAEREKLAQRIIFPMVDEAARCLEEKVVMKPREIDMAIIHGIGFPPFRGGLLKYADQYGLERVAARLRELYGTVAPLIEKYVQEGRNFYSLGGSSED
jgi:3-hydroxyacyl-CoA dehydrogenase/enoyl-CoA hydratase/3-hydroxybutyryl-CoA epimerase